MLHKMRGTALNCPCGQLNFRYLKFSVCEKKPPVGAVICVASQDARNWHDYQGDHLQCTDRAVISACEEGAQWEQSLALLAKMRELGMIAIVISFNTIPACEEGPAVGGESGDNRLCRSFTRCAKQDDCDF